PPTTSRTGAASAGPRLLTHLDRRVVDRPRARGNSRRLTRVAGRTRGLGTARLGRYPLDDQAQGAATRLAAQGNSARIDPVAARSSADATLGTQQWPAGRRTGPAAERGARSDCPAACAYRSTHSR